MKQRTVLLYTCLLLCGLLTGSGLAWGQPEIPVEAWTGRTILFVGAHPDDDSYAQGTLGMLQSHGNEVYLAILTTGNVGTQDPRLSMMDLARIRRQEEEGALKAMGIPVENYVNLGYDDGLLEFADRKEVVAQIVRLIRKIQPDVLFSFDPGKGGQRWHKADHRASAYLTADAARAAMWPLLFQGQIAMEGLQAHEVTEYMLYDSAEEDTNTWVDISEFKDKKIEAMSQYVSQWSSGWYDYKGPELPEEEAREVRERVGKMIEYREGKPVEGFRHYSGSPDDIGR